MLRIQNKLISLRTSDLKKPTPIIVRGIPVTRSTTICDPGNPGPPSLEVFGFFIVRWLCCYVRSVVDKVIAHRTVARVCFDRIFLNEISLSPT